MAFFELAKKRYSVRQFKNQPVEDDKLKYVLETARMAPSACNYQPLSFVVVTDEAAKTKVISSYNREWIKTAPAIIVVCGNHKESWHRGDGKDHCDIDAAIAADHITLAAADIGLGTCWVCAFDSKKCHEALKLPEYIEPIVLLPIGYPEEDIQPQKKRKELDDLIRQNRW
ncbi:MAG: nitroreductase family protein [Xylanivirga thermophila]|jgi:nitroreductase|uniref:nitroreductase family protein n=1 Tax=Xylanivirga thermophila TaxID=2496273 RepID=UPI0039F4D0EE